MKKGNWYYEMQILMYVIMWQHNMNHRPQSNYGLRIGRLFIWRDTAWLYHSFGWKINRVWRWIKTRPEVISLRWQNRWLRGRILFLSHKITMIEFTNSLRAYLRLYKAGFRISNIRIGSDGRFEINRFYWGGKVIREMPDIDRVDNHYNTMNNGHVEKLS